jgi:hypothetical protein
VSLVIRLQSGDVVHAVDHTIARWQERCRPALSIGAAALELRRVAESIGVLTSERPSWMNGAAETATVYLMLGADVALPVTRGTARTCMVAGEPSAAALAERKRIRRERAEVRRRIRGRGSLAGDGNKPRGRSGAR